MSGNTGPETPRTGETFLPLSRGIRKYQRVYTGNGISLWLWILQGADWRPGTEYGILEATLREMREGLGMDRKTIQATLRELSRGYPFPMLSRSGKDTAPSLIDILSKGKRGRQTLYRIRILKAKLRLKDFERFTGNGQKPPEKQGHKDLQEEILDGKIEEIKDLVGNISTSLDMSRQFQGEK